MAAGRGGLLPLAACLIVLWAIIASPARADFTVAVNTTADETTAGDGSCSLREAIAYANGTAQPDCGPGAGSGTTTITVPAGHYVLSGGVLAPTGAMAIDGAGAASTIIDAGGNSEVISVGASARVTLSGVTVTGGASGLVPCTGSGCIFFIGRAGAPGGGIDNAGTLALVNSTISNNVASAGSAALLICFSPGSCPGQSPNPGGAGGGIYNAGTGTLTITGSTITGNKTAGASGGNASAGSSGGGAGGGSGGASGSGGGIDNAGSLTITSSTISSNSTGPGGNAGAGSAAAAGSGAAGGNAGAAANAGSGGGIENTGSLTITASTISANSTGAGGNGAGGGNGDGAGAGGNASSGAAGGLGGGIHSSTGIIVQNSTLTGNATGGGGAVGGPNPGGAAVTPGALGTGGALDQSGAGATLTQDTIAANSSAGTGGGLDAAGGQITYANSIIASNHAASALSNCAGAMVTSQGNNVVFGDNTCNLPEGADPKLGPLTDNGGPTATMALLAGSSAIGLVPFNACPLTTDQRGVTRPQGPRCDAGAYELGRPSLTSAASSASATTSANVTARINPNLRDTLVSVVYGPTTAYGLSTSPQDIGAGNGAVSFAATLGSLIPNTAYHAELVAVNADGTTTSGDLSFTTPAVVATAVGPPSARGAQLSLTISCTHGNATDVCSGPIALTTHETTQAGMPTAVASIVDGKPTTLKKRKPGPKPRTSKVMLAQTTYSIATSKAVTITLTLNGVGKKLLNRFYRLPATLSVGGTSSVTRPVTFSYGRLRISPAYTWAFANSFSYATELTLTGLPQKSNVTVLCHGGGCPFSKRTYSAPKHGKLALAPALKQRHLSPHATVELEITAPNDIGEVVIFTINSGRQPTETFRCLPPGAHRPTACARG